MIRTPSPGPGNGWRHTISSGRPSSVPSRRTSSLNRLAQRLDQLQRHVLGQPADVVVALDHRRRAVAAAALDDVRVERALHEELGVGEPAGVLLEDADEQLADRLALLLGVGDARRAARRSARRRRRGSARCPCCAGTSRRPGRSRPCASARCRRRCTSAGGRSPRWTSAAATAESTPPDRRADHPAVADLRRGSRSTCSSMIDAIVHVGGHAGQLVQEPAQHAHAVRRVDDLGVELHAPDAPRSSSSSAATGASAVVGRGDEAVGRLGDGVEVAHPHVLVVGRVVGDSSDGPVRRSWARPYSPRMPRPTVPPSCWAISWAP